MVVDDSAISKDSLCCMTGVRTLVKYEEALDGVTSGVPCRDRDRGTVATPAAAALEGVWASSAEFRFSLTDR